MHMTLEADYAVRIVEFLAVNPGRADAKTISERTSVTLRFTLKILRTLVSDGIVRSYIQDKGYVNSRHHVGGFFRYPYKGLT